MCIKSEKHSNDEKSVAAAAAAVAVVSVPSPPPHILHRTPDIDLKKTNKVYDIKRIGWNEFCLILGFLFSFIHSCMQSMLNDSIDQLNYALILKFQSGGMLSARLWLSMRSAKTVRKQWKKKTRPNRIIGPKK